jgi:hypothetical protein
METKVIAGFPGTGKTTYFEQNSDCLDSDSSKFSKIDFPNNYIQHIKDNIGKVSYIFVSTHAEVITALINEGIDFTLVYPQQTLKSYYIRKYEQRGSSPKFVMFMEQNFNTFVNDCDMYDCKKIKLKKHRYITSLIEGGIL